MRHLQLAVTSAVATLLLTVPALAGTWVNANGWEYHENGRAVVNRWVPGADQRSWYYIDANGKMATGWIKSNNAWYYTFGDGRMAANQWLESDGSWYFLKAEGAMALNEWVLSPGDGKWYYMSNNGTMLRNQWIQTGSDWYFVGSDGAMLSDTVVGGYYLDGSGRYVKTASRDYNGGGNFGAGGSASSGNGFGSDNISLTIGNSPNAATADKKNEIVNRKILADLRAYNKSGKSIDELSDIEKAMLIVGYTSSIPYDITTTTLNSNFEYADSLYNALETNKGQCYHHALIAQRAGELIGIPVVQVFSNTGNLYSDHQYIAYNIDGDWYRADPTNCLTSTHDANGTEIDAVGVADVSQRDKNEFNDPNSIFLAGGVTIMRMYSHGNQTYQVPSIGSLPTLADFQRTNKSHSMADFNDAMNFVKTGRHLAEQRTNEETALWEAYQENLRASGYTIEIFEESTRAASLAKANARKDELIGSGVTRAEFCRVVDNYVLHSKPNLVFIKWMVPIS